MAVLHGVCAVSGLEALPQEERRHVLIQVAALLLVPTAAVILLVLAMTAGVLWHDARSRSSANRALIERLQQVNADNIAIRKELVERSRAADLRICREVESIKERIRATVVVDTRVNFAVTLRRLNPDISKAQIDALYAQSKERQQEVKERFAPINCEAVSRR